MLVMGEIIKAITAIKVVRVVVVITILNSNGNE